MFNYVFCILAIVVLFSGCSDSLDPGPAKYSDTDIPPLLLVAKGDYPVAINPNNPYDSIGMYHNSALAFVVRRADPYSGDEDSLFDMGVIFLREWPDSMGIAEADPDWGDGIDDALDTLEANRDTDWGDYLANLSSNDYTAKELFYINRIGSLGSNCTTGQQFEDSLLAIEAEICNVTWGTEEYAALIGISVAKHSFYFWATAHEEDYLSKRTEDLPDWIKTALADVAGAIIGTVVWGPGWGTISGAILTSFGASAVGGFWNGVVTIAVAIYEVICFWC